MPPVHGSGAFAQTQMLAESYLALTVYCSTSPCAVDRTTMFNV
jgi:hypothetical protein